ncbi:XRE family transcriptional regulator [Paenibacillus sp. NAIST15-1]|uniref:XRE family transcriptional regulator n=1 Tax=Paenibacillus sp. NAIST15-1 TaxID=1605994 RepID=UPI000869CB38|nr:XRE family transcriptional regulator [Paenibacillus sp. NAIST15-1]GAV14402.1 putative DNA-binding protein [Paenibacillus sp. NAIST15-1]
MRSVMEYEKLGELIRCYRNRENKTQQDFAKEAGIDHDSVIAIEKGEIPLEHAVLKSLLAVLHIPMAEIVAHLVTEEVSTELWLSLLEASLPSQDRRLCEDIVVHVLACCNEDCEDLLLRLYQMIQKWTGSIEMRLELLDNVISYARSRDLQSLVAKGLFYRYLVERDDFIRLDETYGSGQAVLRYVELLSRGERVIFYYKLGVHAFNIERFYESIEIAKRGIDEDSSESTYKAYANLLICSSYFRLEDYDKAEEYLLALSRFPFSFVQEHVDFLTTKLYEKRGNIDLAISQLQRCYKLYPSKICSVNALLRLYLSQNDSTSANQLLQQEQEYLDVDYLNPISIKGHAYYFINKGKWMHRWGKNSEAIDCYIQSVSMFVELTEADEALLRKMERTRLKMMNAAKTGRNLTDVSVVQLSQELDTYIVEIQKKGIFKNSLLRD